MLVLTRKPNERIQIGNDIEVVVLAVRGNKVRLGIAAAPQIPVLRTEIIDRLRGEFSIPSTTATEVRTASLV